MYCTQQDLVARFGEPELTQLTDFTNTGNPDSAMVTIAIDDASNEIDTYLSSRYELPLADTPAVLTAVCADMARYYLYGSGVPEYVADRYKARVDYLSRVAKGTASLPLPETSEPISDDLDGIELSNQGHDWVRGTGGFGV
ncbi:gp436 family protein [Oceanobacter sp. 4_MG-2023]|uniref:gp436 family protein n=1 Tax=Oceanobacter sp. 4_MG-2023 TaxID=3062623 RepID=UPI002736C27C|nr:DUF1320 domain-containing protein [Oceanobacter sp. 4_MG-2023]MDP2548083.1 DUF1320 domain-containing protein [Oceanobacter sp. 4_MG-2023]